MKTQTSAQAPLTIIYAKNGNIVTLSMTAKRRHAPLFLIRRLTGELTATVINAIITVGAIMILLPLEMIAYQRIYYAVSASCLAQIMTNANVPKIRAVWFAAGME